MAKLHSRKDPRLWRGPGSVEYRHTLAGNCIRSMMDNEIHVSIGINRGLA